MGAEKLTQYFKQNNRSGEHAANVWLPSAEAKRLVDSGQALIVKDIHGNPLVE